MEQISRSRLLSVVIPSGDNEDMIMGEYSDKAKGAANQVIGKAKIAIGKQTNEIGLIAEGAGQQAKGKVQTAMGDAKSKLKHRL
jgi:uncharacterized protein YjbJ (UPF0337 family)